MRILHLSDTHNSHSLLHDLPAADVIVHSGDVSAVGNSKDVMDFFVWFCALDYKYKILVAGNHDACLHGAKFSQSSLPTNFFFLCNSGVTIKGVKFWGVKFWGLPNSFFTKKDVDGFQQMLAKIPSDTDILITHRPPYGILDKTYKSLGCIYLLQAVLKISPHYHLFGHIHEAYGIEKLNETTFVNASMVNESDELVNKPVVFEFEARR